MNFIAADLRHCYFVEHGGDLDRWAGCNGAECERLCPVTLQENIRFTSEQWERIENAARERGVSPNQLCLLKI